MFEPSKAELWLADNNCITSNIGVRFSACRLVDEHARLS